MKPINHDARNGGNHGAADYMFFFVYLVFSNPISTWHDSPYANTGVRVDKNVPFSLRKSYDNNERTNVREPIGQLLTVKDLTLSFRLTLLPFVEFVCSTEAFFSF